MSLIIVDGHRGAFNSYKLVVTKTIYKMVMLTIFASDSQDSPAYLVLITG